MALQQHVLTQPNKERRDSLQSVEHWDCQELQAAQAEEDIHCVQDGHTQVVEARLRHQNVDIHRNLAASDNACKVKVTGAFTGSPTTEGGMSALHIKRRQASPLAGARPGKRHAPSLTRPHPPTTTPTTPHIQAFSASPHPPSPSLQGRAQVVKWCTMTVRHCITFSIAVPSPPDLRCVLAFVHSHTLGFGSRLTSLYWFSTRAAALSHRPCASNTTRVKPSFSVLLAVPAQGLGLGVGTRVLFCDHRHTDRPYIHNMVQNQPHNFSV